MCFTLNNYIYSNIMLRLRKYYYYYYRDYYNCINNNNIKLFGGTVFKSSHSEIGHPHTIDEQKISCPVTHEIIIITVKKK
eukprot:gene35-16_t